MNEHLSILLGLGPNAEWPYTEKALIDLINLQKEKEITKQLYYKTENVNKSIELLNRCLNANIPSYLIPMIFSGEGLNQEIINKMVEVQEKTPQPQQSPKHLAPPVSLYRTRPLSPAKIGAAAVSQLDRGRYPSSPIHKRNISLPALSHIAPLPKNSKSPNQKSMMNTIGSIQFVNENPGVKKRRRSNEFDDKENKVDTPKKVDKVEKEKDKVK